MYIVDNDMSTDGKSGYTKAPPCCLMHVVNLKTNNSWDLSSPLKFVNRSVSLYVSWFASHNNIVMNAMTVLHFMQQRPLMGAQKTSNLATCIAEYLNLPSNFLAVRKLRRHAQFE